MTTTQRSLIALAAAVILVAVSTPPAMAQNASSFVEPPPFPSELSLTVTSTVKKAPDIATVSAGVLTQARTAKAAMDDNARRMAAAFVALKAAGIADRDLQTSGINLSPQYTYIANQRPILKGYEATNRVSVRMRKLETIGPVLDALVAQGVNEINGPTFGLDKPEAELDVARSDAMITAMRRAELYARASGQRVKRVLRISEGGSDQPPPVPPSLVEVRMSADSVPDTPVAPGEVSLSIQLNVTFELEK
jgi:uncharacterized protein YggE